MRRRSLAALSPLRLAIAGCVLAIHLTAGAARAQEPEDPRAARVDSLFAAYDRAPGPGLALAVVRNGRVILRRGYGLADIEHRVPITPSTVFDLASVSKQFTGLAVAMLAAEGRIGLGDDVRRYIPELPDFGHPVTIEHLLRHTSGVRDWGSTLQVAGWRYDDVITLRQILDMAYRQRTLNFVPGERELYSNTGYNLLAEVVQRVTRQPFRAWTDEHLFRPLGMTDTHLRDDHTEVIANRAFGYARAADGSWRHTPDNLVAPGSSSVFSSADDMAKWLINYGAEAVGGHAALELMRTPGRLNDGSPVLYGFGLFGGSYRGLPMFTHSGAWASFDTYTVWMPRQRFGVVVLANSRSINAQDAVIRISDIYLEHDFPAEFALQSPGPPSPPPAPPAVTVPPAVLDAYAGLYRLSPGSYIHVRREGAGMTARMIGVWVFGTPPTGEPVAMSPISGHAFRAERYGADLVFERTPAGAVTLVLGSHRVARVADAPPGTPGRLADYAGVYDSEELGTTYRVEVHGDTLVMRHPRHGTIPLKRFWRDDFGARLYFLASVEFQRDRSGRVTGFVVNGDPRSLDLRFTRRR